LNEPVRVLSDLHLGHKVSRIENVSALRPLLEGVGTVIFNGDTWQELAREFRNRSAEMLAELKELCAQTGCEPVFLPGNHDPGWTGPAFVVLAGGKIVVTHGDAIYRDGSPWKREILTGQKRVDEIWARHPRAELEIEKRLLVAKEIARELPSVNHPVGRKFFQRAIDAAFPPSRAIKMLTSWKNQGKAAAEFGEQYFPEADTILIGHFHRHGCWNIGGRRVINTGSFLNPGRAHFVDFENGWMTRGVIEETPEICQTGKVLNRWRV